MNYEYTEIEKKWREYWKEHDTYKVVEDPSKEKFYVLDMFPYPSGAGLHVGHPLGYIASDIYARYKTLEGFNVLHPIGYDAFGLPAEQYAIQTGQHPALTTDQNIKNYQKQFDLLGFNYDLSREFRTCDKSYYKWTQWAVIKFFEHYFNTKDYKAKPITELITEFETSGNANVNAATSYDGTFTAAEWKSKSKKEKSDILQNYRLAFQAETLVNWCPQLGTVLANDEIKDGLSVRGSFPVEQKKMLQWSLRVSAFAQRLLDGLNCLDWSESVKEIQRNWIGRSEGADINFKVLGKDLELTVFTTRPDTIYGVTFMVLAPESDYVTELTTPEQADDVARYLAETKKKTERDRQMDVKNVSGVFSGSYCINPFTNEEIPVWIADYVLGGYGTGAIMAVPAHDERDNRFANHYSLPVVHVYELSNQDDKLSFHDVSKNASTLCTTGTLKDLIPKKAISKAIEEVGKKQIGTPKINYRLRDAIFSRQRYWGEPFPIFFEDDIPTPVNESELPIVLPEVDKYLPTDTGEPPLGRAQDWTNSDGHPLELSTMPGFAGSSAYFLRFMDPKNDDCLVSKEAVEYWENVDLYIGGAEHATGHLIYARFWNMFLFDIGVASKEEPFKKMINQGMIQGRSSFVYRIKGTNKFVSYGLKNDHDTQQLHVYVGLVKDDILDIEGLKSWRPDFQDAEFILEDGKYICGSAVEKMSKSLFNVVNPDDVVKKYGADTLRLFEMFLGPLEQSKPWSTSSIEGVHKFLGRFWRLFFNKDIFTVSDEKATPEELKILHTAIKKVRHDTENFNFNTAIAAMMICVNELTKLSCNKREVLDPLIRILAPYCPHITEELHELLGNTDSVFKVSRLPDWDDSLLVENIHKYPVSLNGKLKFLAELPIDMEKDAIEQNIINDERTQKFIAGKTIRKIIVVPRKIVNIVAN